MCFSGDCDALFYVKHDILIPAEQFSTLIRLVFCDRGLFCNQDKSIIWEISSRSHYWELLSTDYSPVLLIVVLKIFIGISISSQRYQCAQIDICKNVLLMQLCGDRGL